MKKRLLSILLSAVMLISSLPVSVLAAEAAEPEAAQQSAAAVEPAAVAELTDAGAEVPPAAVQTPAPYTTWQNATVVTPGHPTYFTLDTYNNDLTASQVWLAVTVPEDDQAIWLDLASSPLFLDVYLFDADTLESGGPVYKNRMVDYTFTDSNASYSFKVDYAGVYYIMLRPYTTSHTFTSLANVTVSIVDGDTNEDAEAGNNDVWSRATQLIRNVNSYFNLNGGNDVDWFKITTTVPGEAIKIVLSNFDYTVNDIRLQLYSAATLESGGSTKLLDKEYINSDRSYSYKANEPGDYYFRLFPRYSNESVTRALKVRYETVAGDGYELNDSWQTATPIPQDAFEMEFTLNGENDQDWFWFETTEVNEVVNFTIRGFETDYSNSIRYYVYDINEDSGKKTQLLYTNEVDSVSDAARTLQFANVGKHYVCIELYDAVPVENTLRFSIERRTIAIDGGEPNDTWQTATTIYADLPQTFNLPAATDVDYFKFTVNEANQTVEFTLTVPAGGSLYNTALYSEADFIADGNNAYSMTTWHNTGSGSGSGVKTLRYMLGDAGTYYLRLRPYSSSYVFDADATVTYTLIEPDGNERNNSWQTATPLTEGVAAAFTLSADNDYDWFKVTTTEPDQTVQFTLSIPAGGTLGYTYLYSEADFVAQGNNANSMTYWTEKSSGVHTLRYMLGDAGTYYLRLKPDGSDYIFDADATITYTLIEPDGNERNNSFTTATPLRAQNSISFTLPATNDYDWFKLDSITPGDRITVRLSDIPTGDGRIYCYIYCKTEYETSATQQTYWDFGHSSGGNWSKTYTAQEEGDYYIRLYHSSTWMRGAATLRYSIARDDVNISAVGISSINNAPTTIFQGKTLGLYPVITPANATNQNVTWISSNPEVATVSADGLVTAVAPGTTKITVTTEDGGYSATSTITVVAPIPVEGVTVTSNEVKHEGETEDNPKLLSQGTAIRLYYKTIPETATEQEVVWAVSDPEVLAVTDYGKVAAVGSGSAYVTVTTADGGFVAKYYVNVPDETAPVKRITLNANALTLYMEEEATQITANIYPSYATNPLLRWSSDNPAVATVDELGNVTPVGEGYATITAAAQENESITATCSVCVQPKRTRVSSISFDTELVELGLYGVTSLSPIVGPEDATDKTVTWSTSNKNIVSVSRNGVITGLNLGTAIITATTNDGGLTASVTVQVSSNAPLGDVSNDGIVDAADALLILRSSVRLLALSDVQKAVADLNGDGEIDAGDAVLILRYDAGLIDEFPAQKQ